MQQPRASLRLTDGYTHTHSLSTLLNTQVRKKIVHDNSLSIITTTSTHKHVSPKCIFTHTPYVLFTNIASDKLQPNRAPDTIQNRFSDAWRMSSGRSNSKFRSGCPTRPIHRDLFPNKKWANFS